MILQGDWRLISECSRVPRFFFFFFFFLSAPSSRGSSVVCLMPLDGIQYVQVLGIRLPLHSGA